MEKSLANNFALSDVEDNASSPLNRGGIADLLLLRTLLAIRQKSWEPSFCEVMDSFVLVAYESFTASRTFLQRLLACLNFTLDSDNLFCWLKQKKVISMNYDSSTSCWKPWRWVRFDLILTMRDIYINSNLNPLTKFTSSSRSTEFKDILLWNISQIITTTMPISPRIVIIHTMKRGILFWVYWKVDGNWDNNMIRPSQWRESHCRTNISVRINKYIRKSRTVRVTVREASRKVNYLSKVVWDSKIITDFTRSISSIRIG